MVRKPKVCLNDLLCLCRRSSPHKLKKLRCGKDMTEQLAHKQMSEQLKLADAVQRVSSYAEEVVGAPAAAAAAAAAPRVTRSRGAASAATAGGDAEARYKAALDKHRFSFVPELAHITAPGSSAALSSAARAAGGSARMRRLASEAASCQKNLPLEFSSSCFVRVVRATPLFFRIPEFLRTVGQLLIVLAVCRTRTTSITGMR